MLRTIQVSSCIYVQGIFVKSLPDGRIMVRVGKEVYSGFPIGAQSSKPETIGSHSADCV